MQWTIFSVAIIKKIIKYNKLFISSSAKVYENVWSLGLIRGFRGKRLLFE